MEKLKHVVVVGAGFGGLEAVKKLSHFREVKVTWIDKYNHHLFQPLLYQVATGVLSPADISIPPRAIISDRRNVSVYMAEVTGIDKDKQLIYFDGSEMQYDFLILAMGAKNGYFGKNQWAEHTIGLKSIKDAIEIRRRILLSFEKAEIHPERAEELLNFIIIGGGPTGVELAGSIAELSHQIMLKEFRNIDPRITRITLIEAGERLLSTFDTKLSDYTRKQLEERGVKVLLKTRVQNIDENGVHLENELLKSNLIIWAAGVEANPFGERLGFPVDRTKRVIVNKYCSFDNYPNLFVIGDMAAYMTESGKPLPGVSPVAMQQGRYVAKVIINDIKGKPREDFHYKDKGSMATIGRKDAISQVGNFKMKGFMGWLAWLFVHLYYLVGFKNRISTLLTWMWSYLTVGAGARVIQEANLSPKPPVVELRDEEIKHADLMEKKTEKAQPEKILP